MGGALTVHAVESVPAGLEISLAAGSVAAAASGSSGLLSNFMLMTKTKIAIGTALMAGIVATPLIIQQHALAALFVARQRTLNALRAGNDSLRRQAELEQSAFVAAVRESPANSVAGLSKADEKELLRLRSKIVPLREQLRDASNRVVLLQRPPYQADKHQ